MAEVYLDIIARIDKVQADVKNLQGEMTKLETKSEEVNKTIRTEFESTSKVTSQLTGLIAGMFSVGAVTAFIKKIIDLRIEWEKQTAVLKTLTGSQKEAESTMKMIKKVADASLSPLKEVSDAYIRLVNQGIKPTYSEMKKMVDVAVASGRSFGQLAEAIFDATNGQLRGLKDFGIQSKIIGDKMQLSFKGMTQTVDMTGEAIADFVIKAGELPGVAGASEELGKTVAGAFDNIGDSVESLILTLGELSSDTMVKAANTLTDLITVLNFVASSGEKAKTGVVGFIVDFLKVANPLLLLNKGVTKGWELLANAINKSSEELEDSIAPTEDSGESIEEFTKRIHALVVEMQKGMPMDKWAEQQRKAAIEFAKMMQEIPDEETEFKWIIPPPEKTKEQADVTAGLVEDMYDKLEQSERDYIDHLELKEQNKQRIIAATFDFTSGLINSLSQYQRQKMDEELRMAGDNEAKKEEIRRKYAKKEQSIAIAESIMGVAQVVINAMQTKPFIPAGLAASILAGVLGAVQIGVIKSQKFATGTFDLQGRGTGTSDSIPAMLSRGESVMTANETKEYYPYLKAMKEGKFLKLQLEQFKDLVKLNQVTNNSLNYDNSKEIRELREIRKALSRDSETIEGKYKVIRRGGITTKISLS